MTGPQEQERKAGHALMHVSGDVHAEVSLYNWKVYFSLRRWFRADDGKWYRTKNGLHLKYDEMIEVLAQTEQVLAFGMKEAERLEVPKSTTAQEAEGGSDVEY